MYFYLMGNVRVYRVNKETIRQDIRSYYGEDTDRDMSDDSLEDWMTNSMDWEDLDAECLGYQKEEFNRFASWEIRKTVKETDYVKIN